MEKNRKKNLRVHMCVRARTHTDTHTVFPGGSLVKNPPANAGGAGLILWLRRSPRGGNGNPLQYSCLEISLDREACRPWGRKESAATEHVHIHI